MIDLLSSIASASLTSALDVTWENHSRISANIANANVAGYKASRIDFEKTMRALDVSQHGYDAGLVKANLRVETLENSTLDAEMVALTQNTVRYESLVSVRSALGSLTKTAISGNN